MTPRTWLGRHPQARWLVMAAAAGGAAWLAVAEGRPTIAWIFAFASIMALYGSIDHLAEPAVDDLRQPRRPELTPSLPEATAHPVAAPPLTSRQRRVMRFLAYGLPDDEIAELLDVDEPTIAADVDRIVSVLEVDDRTLAVQAARDSAVPAVARALRPAA